MLPHFHPISPHPRSPHPRSRIERSASFGGRAIRVLALVAIAGMLGGTTVGAESEISEARRRRDDVRDQQAEAAAELDLLEAQDDEVAAAVADIQAAVDNQRAQVDAARLALAAAESEVARQVEYRQRLQSAIDDARLVARRRAVDAFVGVSAREGEIWLGDTDPNESARMIEYLRATSGSYQDAFDRLRALEEVQGEVIGAAEDAQGDADSLRVDLEAALAELSARLVLQVEIQNSLEDRINRIEAELAEFEAEEARIEADLEEAIRREFGSLTRAPSAASLQGFGRPTAGAYGSGFGMRLHPILGYARAHNGIDIAGDTGDAIWAAKSGTVFFAGSRGGYGNCVIIDHGDGVMTIYAHMSRIDVSVGSSLDKGELIGAIGSTGLSTGPHLHFEVRINGQPADPLAFLP